MSATPTNGPATAPPAPVESLIREISEIEVVSPKEQAMPNESFDADLVVIGAGPGGYVAAIRAAQLGAKVICVEKQYLGGTCLNWGCIPSKALIASVERLEYVRHAEKLGVKIGGEAAMDFAAMIARKDKIVQTQRGGVGMLFKKNGVQHVEGFASFVDPNTIEVRKDADVRTIRAKAFVLAMGSSVIHLTIPGLEGKSEANVWTSDDAVNAPFVPKSMLVLGGGAVGVEFSYVFNGLGSKVTVVEMMPNLIPGMDADLGVELGKLLSRKGIQVRTGATLDKCEKTEHGWRCFVKKGVETEEIEVEVVLLGVGRKANLEGVQLDKAGVQTDRRGVHVMDGSMRTHAPHIYAIGDIVSNLPGHLALAHVASHEGIVAVTNAITGADRKVDLRALPACVYTVPEVASVGLSEEDAKSQGYDVKVGKFLFRPLGKAMASTEQDGFVKVVADAKYGEVLGVHMIGAHVTDMIHEGVAAIKLEATLESMTDTIHAHPTMSEAVLEAFEDAAGHAIHKM